MKSAFLQGFWALLLAGRAFAGPEGIELCRHIARTVPEIPIYAVAEDHFPDDPVHRALEIQKKLGVSAVPFHLQLGKNVLIRDGMGRRTVATYDWLVPYTTGGHPSLRAIPDLKRNSVFYVSPNDIYWHGDIIELPGEPVLRFKEFIFSPHAAAETIDSWGSGLTGVISNSGRVFTIQKVLNGAKPEGRIQRTLVAKGLWMDTAGVSIDLPFHGAGPFNPKYFSLEESLNWRLEYYRFLQTGNLPIVGCSRSGESLYLAQLAADHPELFAGLIWMSPMHPVHGFDQTIKGYNEQNVLSGAAQINPTALRWFAETNKQKLNLPKPRRWWETELAQPDVPILVIVGEHDLEVPKETRDYYKSLARKNPSKFFYVEVPGAGHDPFSVTENWVGDAQLWSAEAENRAIGAWEYVYWFKNAIVLKKKNIPVPDRGWLHR